MTFRVSTNQIFAQNLQSVLRQQYESSQTQQQLSTGKKILTPDDDPLGSVRLLSIERNLSKTEQYQRNADAGEVRLNIEEQTLSSSINVIQRVRDLALQGINGSNDNSARLLISQEIDKQLDNLIQLGNTKDGNGDYLFSGFQGSTKPFVETGTGISYQGDQGQRLIRISATLNIEDSDPGDDVYMKIDQGNGDFFTSAGAANTGTALIGEGVLRDPSSWGQQPLRIVFDTDSSYEVYDDALPTPNLLDSGAYVEDAVISVMGTAVSIRGEPRAGDTFDLSPSRSDSIFSAVTALRDALASSKNNDVEVAAMINTINGSISSFDRAIENFNEFRTTVGIRLNQVDRQKDANDEAAFNLQAVESTLKDVDYAEAISKFNRQLVALQAAQQSFTKMQGISLFNYIN